MRASCEVTSMNSSTGGTAIRAPFGGSMPLTIGHAPTQSAASSAIALSGTGAGSCAMTWDRCDAPLARMGRCEQGSGPIVGHLLGAGERVRGGCNSCLPGRETARAGLPTTRAPTGTSRTTTAPAPITASRPIVTFGMRLAPVPMKDLAPKWTIPADRTPGQMCTPSSSTLS